MTRIPLERRLATAGQLRREAEQLRGIRSHDLRQAVKAADRKGWTKTRIAEVSGLSRQTVHEMLRD